MSLPTAEADSIPVSVGTSDANHTVTWNGTYIVMTVTVSGTYYAMAQTWIAYLTATTSGQATKLDAKVTVHSVTDIAFEPLFFEHFKGDYHGSFQGFYADDTNKWASCWMEIFSITGRTQSHRQIGQLIMNSR